MKNLLFVSLFFTSSLLACPDLAGLYRVCRSANGEMSKLRIKQMQNTYTIAWSTERTQIHIADGVARTTPIFDMGFSLVSKAWCEEGVLYRALSTLLDSGETTQSIEQEYFLEDGKLRFRASDENGVFKDIVCKK